MDARRGEAPWTRIRQRRLFDGADFYAERLFETQQAARSYAHLLESRGGIVQVAPSHTEGGKRGYAVFVRRER